MNSEFWNARFSGEDFFYGTLPNEFVAAVADRIPAGPVLCLGEGEGRNAIFLASRGHHVTAVDQSDVGLAKARRLAAGRGLANALTTAVADLAEFAIAPDAWSAVVATFVHLPVAIRRVVHARAAAGLRRGGVFILEAYTPAQLAHDTGGPRDPALLMNAATLCDELAGLDFDTASELERDVREGAGHTGRGAVVQILARRP